MTSRPVNDKNTSAANERRAGARRYTVDLVEQQSFCEANYARLLKLMPTFDDREQWQYEVQSGARLY